MARDRKRHVKGREVAAEAALAALSVGSPSGLAQHAEHRLRLELFIKAMARDLARIDHDRDPS